ncbi:MAG: MsnO8 family LLM class oxidoreductase [Pseudomonadota bacterium]
MSKYQILCDIEGLVGEIEAALNKTYMTRLSILDPSPVFQGRSAANALSETRALAQATDQMRYRSYWVQEHHNAASFAGTAPEVLMADLAAHTQRLSLGSGGIMLPNYSPLKVAELGQTLSALHPGRIEIGLGRATGADPRASAALLGPGAQTFPTMLRLAMDWWLDASDEKEIDADHRATGIAANPPAPRPDLWLLCSSPESAAFAGRMGVKLAYADFLNPDGAVQALRAYREAFDPSPFASDPYCAIGLVALAAQTQAEAERLSSTMLAWSMARQTGQFTPYLMADEATQALRSTGATAIQSHAIIGAAEEVADRLAQKAATANADELFVLTITESLESRIASYALLDEAFH